MNVNNIIADTESPNTQLNAASDNPVGDKVTATIPYNFVIPLSCYVLIIIISVPIYYSDLKYVAPIISSILLVSSHITFYATEKQIYRLGSLLLFMFGVWLMVGLFDWHSYFFMGWYFKQFMSLSQTALSVVYFKQQYSALIVLQIILSLFIPLNMVISVSPTYTVTSMSPTYTVTSMSPAYTEVIALFFAVLWGFSIASDFITNEKTKIGMLFMICIPVLRLNSFLAVVYVAVYIGIKGYFLREKFNSIFLVSHPDEHSLDHMPVEINRKQDAILVQSNQTVPRDQKAQETEGLLQHTPRNDKKYAHVLAQTSKKSPILSSYVSRDIPTSDKGSIVPPIESKKRVSFLPDTVHTSILPIAGNEMNDSNSIQQIQTTNTVNLKGFFTKYA